MSSLINFPERGLESRDIRRENLLEQLEQLRDQYIVLLDAMTARHRYEDDLNFKLNLSVAVGIGRKTVNGWGPTYEMKLRARR